MCCAILLDRKSAENVKTKNAKQNDSPEASLSDVLSMLIQNPHPIAPIDQSSRKAQNQGYFTLTIPKVGDLCVCIYLYIYIYMYI